VLGQLGQHPLGGLVNPPFVYGLDSAAFATALLVGEALCPWCSKLVTTRRLTELYSHISEPYGEELILVFHLTYLMKDDPVEPLVPCRGSEMLLRPWGPR
jgi:hypothetical protein